MPEISPGIDLRLWMPPGGNMVAGWVENAPSFIVSPRRSSRIRPHLKAHSRSCAFKPGTRN